MAIWNKLFGNQTRHTDDPIDQIRASVSSGNALLLDVRSQLERDAGFIVESVFIDFEDVQTLTENSNQLNSLSKDKVIYCH